MEAVGGGLEEELFFMAYVHRARIFLLSSFLFFCSVKTTTHLGCHPFSIYESNRTESSLNQSIHRGSTLKGIEAQPSVA